jgi:hypothetical protein
MKKRMITFALVAVFVFAGFAARSEVNAFAIVHPDVREQLVGSVARSRARCNAEGPSDLRSNRAHGGAAFEAGANRGNDCGRMQRGGKNSRDE